MGQVVIMKKFFDREAFLLSGFDKKQKRQSLLVSLLLVLFFIVSAFTFFNALYGFVDVIGSIVSGSIDVALRDIMRSIPLILSAFMSIWALLLLQAFYRNPNPERWKKSVMKDSICLLCFALANLLFVIIGRFAGVYLSLVEGSPSPWYPLDSILFSLIFIALGVLAILYVKRVAKDSPYVVPSRGEVRCKARGLYCTFLAFWLLMALFGFSAGLFSIFIYDFLHGHAFFGVATVIAYLMPPLFLAAWEFYYHELKMENKKRFLLPLAIVGLVVSIFVAALYFISLGLDRDAPSNAGFGMFPIAFAASVNIATMLVVSCPLIVSIVALVNGLRFRKKAN